MQLKSWFQALSSGCGLWRIPFGQLGKQYPTPRPRIFAMNSSSANRTREIELTGNSSDTSILPLINPNQTVSSIVFITSNLSEFELFDPIALKTAKEERRILFSAIYRVKATASRKPSLASQSGQSENPFDEAKGNDSKEYLPNPPSNAAPIPNQRSDGLGAPVSTVTLFGCVVALLVFAGFIRLIFWQRTTAERTLSKMEHLQIQDPVIEDISSFVLGYHDISGDVCQVEYRYSARSGYSEFQNFLPPLKQTQNPEWLLKVCS